MELCQPKSSIELDMPNMIDHTTYEAFGEETLLSTTKDTPSSTPMETELGCQLEDHEKMFYSKNNMMDSSDVNGIDFPSPSNDIKGDHLTPTEETSKKLELSLDELIQQKHVKHWNTQRETRKSLVKQHGGARYHMDLNNGRSTGYQKKPSLVRKPPGIHGPSSKINFFHSSVLPYHGSNRSFHRMTLPHSKYLQGNTNDSMQSSSIFLNSNESSLPHFSSAALNLPYRISLRNATRLNHSISKSLFPPPHPDATLFPKSRNSNRFVQSRCSHSSFNPYGSCASVTPSYVDPLVLAEDFALAEVEISYPPPIEEGTDPSLVNSLIVKFKNTNVLTIRKASGDMILSSGGWKTLSTQLVLNHALKPLGLWIETKPTTNVFNSTELNDATKDVCMDSSEEKVNDKTLTPNYKKLPRSQQWVVMNGKFFVTNFHDDMVIGQIGVTHRSQLMARASVVAQHLKQIKNNALLRSNFTRNKNIPV
ncbi:uncharacterized protein LOC128883478 isoform X1 [Hylaeus volcanicus]|uniref:uncharacterized protein LOC128883478 isoform X1 n=1 Tax=Hylaeus volcanicus TaxID=313075 RepID=UPI0023B79343|nr:uncharacterized protein LOC128883478 isoform X1 [Hylaeus volcanicus]XP_053991844.1 uncharacterized protein LOC128883478 isoform X1 [Hylaeus volcanicus]